MTNEIKLPEPDGALEIDCGPHQYDPGRLVECVDGYTTGTVLRLIAEAVAAEREACANLCDNARQEYQFPDVAFLIRAKG